MLEPVAGPVELGRAQRLPRLHTATLLDEALLDARQADCVVAVRFGRDADPLCHAYDARLRAAVDGLKFSTWLSAYAVDIEEVPEFTHMYELYDPFTLMLFHRSKPVLVDAGFGPTPKLTELPPLAPLARLLAGTVRHALELSTTEAPDPPFAAGGSNVDHGQPDDPTTLTDEANRLAQRAGEWLHARATPLADRASGALRTAEERLQARSLAALQRAGEGLQRASEGLAQGAGPRGWAALESARALANAWMAPPAASAAGAADHVSNR